MKISREEATKKANQKTAAIKTLCQQLGMELTAKQIITDQGFIENIVYFFDTEKYEIKEDEPALGPHAGYTGPAERKSTQNDEKTTDIREQGDQASDGVRPDDIRSGEKK